MLRFTLFGFPVAIHWMFWVTIALVSGRLEANTPEQMQRLVLWVAAAVASILIHELGHTFMMRRYGARSSIMLYAFGGLAIPDRGFNRTQQIIVSLAGPLVEIAFGLAAYALLQAGDAPGSRLGAWLPYYLLRTFYFISIFWGLFNLVPIYPLDGGQVLFQLLGPARAKTTYAVGILCAVAVAFWMFSLNSIFSAILFGMLAFENLQRIRGATPNSILRPF